MSECSFCGCCFSTTPSVHPIASSDLRVELFYALKKGAITASSCVRPCCLLFAARQESAATGSGRCHWKVFYPEQHIAAAGSPISSVIVITKGAVRMRFPRGLHARDKDHTVVASVGELCGTASTARCCWLLIALRIHRRSAVPRLGMCHAGSCCSAAALPPSLFAASFAGLHSVALSQVLLLLLLLVLVLVCGVQATPWVCVSSCWVTPAQQS